MLRLAVFVLWIECVISFMYRIDDSLGHGRRFDGIGAISGGGATSKLLMSYEERVRDEILDYLFKPNFGASLHMLKVEIGGDSQSTDGSESSHMHTADDENYERGYEWWLMKEAKRRNPLIKLYGLPWVFPGWLGGDTFNPYSNRSELVRYIVGWVRGAQQHHGLMIDFVGIWNERPYDVTYIKMLRAGLDKAGLSHVQIVVTDAEWNIVSDLFKDPDLLSISGPIGVHYPGSYSPAAAIFSDLPLWASEEFSAFNNLAGGGCWARILSESYATGYLSSVIAWNLITSYYDNLPYRRSSLMVANEPWSGHYEVSSPIWMTAHFTQFMAPGWHYLLHGHGVGRLANNGSYVSLASPDGKDLTIVLETMSPLSVPCFYPMPHYKVTPQEVQIELKGSYVSVSELNVWHSWLDFFSDRTVLFERLPPVQVVNGTVRLTVPINSIFTLTTLRTGIKGMHPTPPPSAPFPSPYHDNFDAYPEHAEAFNFAQQAGAFEIHSSGDLSHGKVMVQMVPRPPVDTCRPKRMTRPVSLMGSFYWADVDVQYDFYLEKPPEGALGVFLAARVSQGGCDTMYSNGLYLWVLPEQQAMVLTGNHSRSLVYVKASVQITYKTWHTLRLVVKDQKVQGYLNASKIIDVSVNKMPSARGFIGLGTENFAKASFDNFKVVHLKDIKEGQNEWQIPVYKPEKFWNELAEQDTRDEKNVQSVTDYKSEDGGDLGEDVYKYVM